MDAVEKFKSIVDKYSVFDVQEVHDAIDMLCQKGIPNGCFQNYEVLMDILAVLEVFENAIKEKEGSN